jgi:hypothetical protein
MSARITSGGRGGSHSTIAITATNAEASASITSSAR